MSANNLNQREEQPLLILSCQRDSHPFQERTIVLNDIIKVGRSVARVRPSPNNAIFDCKVLSRSHALVWYKNGQFWLRDTNSSNGTFVNNTRLVKKSADEYADREIFSGDIIRFGVDVVENETTHGCIIAQVTLYYPDGVEAKQNVDHMASSNGAAGFETFHAEQMFQLTSYVNEALLREQALETKLDSLRRLLQETQDISEAGWEAMLNEDRLLEKLELYESQLYLLKSNLPDDSLQSHLSQVLEEKFNIERASKAMLDRVLNEKTEALRKVTKLECCLADSERECSRLRQDCETAQEAYQTVATNFQTKSQELEELVKQLHDTDGERSALEAKLSAKVREAESLECRLAHLLEASPNITSHEGQNRVKGVGVDLNGVPMNKDETREKIGEMVDLTNKLQTSLNQRADEVRDEMALAELAELDRFCDIQECIATSEANLEQVLDATNDGVSSHVAESVHQFNQSMQLIRALQEELSNLANFKSLWDLDGHSIPPTIPSRGPVPDAAASYLEIGADTGSKAEVKTSGYISPNVMKNERGCVGDHTFSATLSRARELALMVEACHARAEASLSNFCAQHSKQKSNVCTTGGDICAPPPMTREAADGGSDKLGEQLMNEESVEVIGTQLNVISTVSPDVLRQSPPGVPSIRSVTVGADAANAEAVAEVARLREELRVSASETEAYKQLAENLQQQDAAKVELLSSVREECDALRRRISLIESEVTTSRADHKRLAAEAKRARSEADELRQQRDSLILKLNDANHRAEQLDVVPSTLVEPGSSNKTRLAQSMGLASAQTDPGRGSFKGIESADSGPNGLAGGFLPAHSQSLLSWCGSTASVFVVIPLMVLLCAVMIIIFSKLSK